MSNRGEGVEISHLLFTNDALVFSEPSQDLLTYLSWLVNLEKSELVLVGRVNNLEEWALEFGYKVGALPSSYFDFFSGSPFKSVAVWNGVEERFHKKLCRKDSIFQRWEAYLDPMHFI